MENKGKSVLRMKLTLEGLYELNNDEIIVELEQEVKKHFILKLMKVLMGIDHSFLILHNFIF